MTWGGDNFKSIRTTNVIDFAHSSNYNRSMKLGFDLEKAAKKLQSFILREFN
jgi:hypothetical protein